MLSLDELEKKIEKLLPDAVVLFVDHCALNFDRNIADFVHESLVGGVNRLDDFKDDCFDGVTAGVRKTLPQVGIVLLVGQVGCINSLGRDVSSENNSGKGLSLDRNLALAGV